MSNPKVGEVWKVPFHGSTLYVRVEDISINNVLIFLQESVPMFSIDLKYFENPNAKKLTGGF